MPGEIKKGKNGIEGPKEKRITLANMNLIYVTKQLTYKWSLIYPEDI